MVGGPPVLANNRFVWRSQSFTNLSWNELAELSLQKESSSLTAFSVSFVNNPYQAYAYPPSS